MFNENAGKHVIVYGACSHMGTTCTNILIKYGYSVILIDTNLHKLQNLRLQLTRTFID